MSDSIEPPLLPECHERLQWARRNAGFDNPTDAARRFGWNENSYRSHENGNRGFSNKVAEKYAKAYKVPISWLIYNEQHKQTVELGDEVNQKLDRIIELIEAILVPLKLTKDQGSNTGKKSRSIRQPKSH